MRSIALTLGLVVVSAAISPTTAAEVGGNWNVGFAQGYTEYSVGNGPGNSFMFGCDTSAAPDGKTKNTNIFIEIIGKAPPPNSLVQVFLDGAPVQLWTDARGTVGTDCHVCSDAFAAVWKRARSSKQMIVSLADGRSVTLKTAGAAKALPAKHCTTGFES